MRSPFTQGLGRDLASLWFEAPMVIAMRMQAAGIALMTGSTTQAAEFSRMVTEKISASAESAIALNHAMAQQGMDAALAVATGRMPRSAEKVAENITAAAVKPYSKRVRANARRLTARKDG
jgi:hypothetical protein